jgi:hypothetical protein
VDIHFAALIAGSLIVVTILWDAFETIALPRTAKRRVRPARLFYRTTWELWIAVARLLPSDRSREDFLALYGPLSIFGLLAVWAGGLIIGFALLLGSQRALVNSLPGESLWFDLFYLSGSSLFTLGLGDVAPHDRIGRILTVAEAGIGLGLLTLVLSYLPVLYGSFSRREVRLTLLDIWAGSPPSAARVLHHLAETKDRSALTEFLQEWEYWCSEVLESHLSYPAVAYFRSQHHRQSWVSALTTVLDVSALLKVGVDQLPTWRAHRTFAIARHAAADLAQILGAPLDFSVDRLPPAELAALERDLQAAGLSFRRSADAAGELAALRRTYEPYVVALSRRLMMPAPPWRNATATRYNWQSNPRKYSKASLRPALSRGRRR